MIPVPQTVSDNLASGQTWPILLFQIGGSPNLYFTDSDMPVFYAGQTWQPKGISYSKISKKLGLEPDRATITIDNLDDSMIAWSLAADPTGYITTIRKGVTDGQLDGSSRLLLIADTPIIMFHGKNTNAKADTEFELYCSSLLDLAKQNAPRSTQDVTCRFRGIDGFKGPNCGYAGTETTCNYTEARCRELGNIPRFGGFPTLTTKTDR